MRAHRGTMWRRALGTTTAAIAVAVAVACGESGSAEAPPLDAGVVGPGAQLDGAAADASPDAKGGPATLLATGDIALTGVTSDGYAIYRRFDVVKRTFSLWAISISGGAPIELSADMGGGQFVGRVINEGVGFWTGVGPEGLGTFNIWTKKSGLKSAPGAQSYRNLFTVTPGGELVMFSSGVSDGGLVDGGVRSISFAVAPVADLSATTRMDDINIAAMESNNCPVFTYTPVGGQAIFLVHCTGTAESAIVGRVVVANRLGDGGLETSVLLSESSAATAIVPFYGASIDRVGSKMFVVGAAPFGQGRVIDVATGTAAVLDEGVSFGVVTPDGGSVYYRHDDVLARASTNGTAKVTLVDGGFDHIVDVAADERRILFSSIAAQLSDLQLTDTTTPGAPPTSLVPDASVVTAAFTEKGDGIVYATYDPGTEIADCYLAHTDGSAPRKIAGGVGFCSRVQPTNVAITAVNPHRLGPFPVVDLQTVDLGSAALAPIDFEKDVFDFRNADNGIIVFVKAGAEAGLYARALP